MESNCGDPLHSVPPHEKPAGLVHIPDPKPWKPDNEMPVATPDDRHVQQLLKLQENTGLFIEFAESSPGEQGLRQFWAKWGGPKLSFMDFVLPATVNAICEVALEKKANRQADETVRLWLRHQTVMRECLGVWRLICQNDRVGLESRITWTCMLEDRPVSFRTAEGEEIILSPGNGHRVTIRTGEGDEVISSPGVRSYALSAMQVGDVFSPAYLFVSAKVNEMMEPLVSTRVLFHGRPQDSAALVNPLRLHIVPKDFLGALWLQFAESLSDQIHNCDICGKTFLIRPPASRATKRYCGQNCRQKHYEARRKRASELAAGGVAVTHIAS